MKKRMLATLLAAVMALALLPASALAAELPQAGIRDIQTHYWADVPEMTIDSVESFNEFRNAVTVTHPVQLILYDNGELYLSTKEMPDEKSFSLVAENVKEISTVPIPLIGGGTYGIMYYPRSGAPYWPVSNYVLTANLTTVLTEDGELYLMGCPLKFKLSGEAFVGSSPYRVFAEKLYPFSYAADWTDLIKIADGIAHIVPGYQYQSPAYSNLYNYNEKKMAGTRYTASYGYRGFYVDDLGNSYFGFPAQEEGNELASPNIINYLPTPGVQLLEDGTLQNNTAAKGIKDLCEKYYLTNDGVLYDYANNEVATEVTMISKDYFIREDGAVWSTQGKIMEDVAAVFGNYAVRDNGDVYILENDSSGQLLPRKFLNGNGCAPNPAPAIHAGKIFKDASTWALVDLRAARDSGLTIPADGLSYNTPITREKFAEVAVKLYEALSGKKAPAATQNPFTDTKNPEILKAYSLGIVKGTGEGKFSPDARIDRESIAVMLLRAVNAGGARLNKGAAVSFTDAASISGWAKDSVDAMAKANVIRGVGGNRFDPKGTATVEQAIIMANRILP